MTDDHVDRTPDDEAGVRAAERRLDADVERMARESERVERRIERTRRDWEAKRADPRLPGARPREDERGETDAAKGGGGRHDAAHAADERGR